MRECNVVMSVEDSVAESMIGHRIRTYLMQLLVSDEPIPAQQQMSAMALLMRFLSLPSAPDLFNGKLYHTSASPVRFDSRRASRNTRSESPRARKRRRLCDNATPSTHDPYERSAGQVRLRFTYSGFQRLQRILLCPSRPPAITQRRARALEEPIHSHSIRTVNGNPQPMGKYQCWLRDCGEVFQTAGDVVDHVQDEHPASMKAAAPAVGRALARLLGSM